MPQSARFQKLAADAKSRVREVSAAEASQSQKEGALLVDVRETEEFAKGHATGAIHLSRGTIELKIEDAAPDMATPIVCYCGGGSRSASRRREPAKNGLYERRFAGGGLQGVERPGAADVVARGQLRELSSS